MKSDRDEIPEHNVSLGVAEFFDRKFITEHQPKEELVPIKEEENAKSLLLPIKNIIIS